MAGYAGKYCRKRRIPLASWVLILLAGMSLMVGGVVAYLSASTGAVTNRFIPEVAEDPVVVETFEDNEKTNVKVDVGEPGYAVYIRAAVVVTWKDTRNGDVLGVMPQAGVDYTMSLGDKWFLGSDGFYYYSSPVAYDGEHGSTKLTENLINSCKPIDGKTPAGYHLNVEIISQTIQALGTTDVGDKPAVADAWGVAVKDGKLTPAT